MITPRRRLFSLFVPLTAALLLPSLAHAEDRCLQVDVDTGDGWRPAGCAPFSEHPHTGQVMISPADSGPTRVRLTRRGGGLAHLDAIDLDDAELIAAEGVELDLATGRDHDVADISEGSTVLTFDGSRDSAPVVLRLVARIEPEVIAKVPFVYPRQNTHHPVSPRSAFFSYALESAASEPWRLDGSLASESLGAPFLRDGSIPVASGHPNAPFFAWVRHDDDSLYVAFDFAADNTMDGLADYAKVHVRHDGRVHTFDVDVEAQRWGQPGFERTDRAAYRHKVYEFEIPFAAFGGSSSEPRVELAFEAYGTASAGVNQSEPVAYNPNSDEFLHCWWESTGNGYELRVSRYDAYANEVGTPVDIDATTGAQPFCAVAVRPADGSFLVAYADHTDKTARKARAALVTAQGSVTTTAIEVSDTTTGANAQDPKIAFDPDNDRYLVVWTDDRSGNTLIRGRFVAPDGTPDANGGFDISPGTSNINSGSLSVT